MRPQGVIRVALLESATRLADERGGASWREIASSATLKVEAHFSIGGEREQRGISVSLARQTVKNMVFAGDLVEVGREKREGSPHWHALYAPPESQNDASMSGVALRSLNDLVSNWARCSG